MLQTYHVAVFIGVAVFVKLCQLFSLAYKPGLRQIPGPWPARFTGLWRVHFIWTGQAHLKYRQLHQRFGPIVRTAPNVIDVSDPSEIANIYGINSKFTKSGFYSSFSPVYENRLMPSMFSTRDLDEHRRLKRAVSQKYSMTAVKSLEYLVDPCGQIFMNAMTEMEGHVVDLGAWLQWYAFDVIGAITFSKRFGFLENQKDMYGIIAGIDRALKVATVVGQVPWLHDLLLGNLVMRSILMKILSDTGDASVTVLKMVDDRIQEYDVEAARKDARADFLAYLLQQRTKEQNEMTKRDMMNYLTNNLLAGSDTTGISLRAVFYYLIKNKRVYDKLRQEIDGAASKLSSTITYAECLELPYLQACIKEATRLHPGVSLPLERVVPPGGATLCGQNIPAGTTVGMNAAVIHYDSSIFGDDAHEFRPERWLDCDEERVKNMDRHLMTFGAGTRTCIGKNISIMEMGKIVPQILREFDIEWASEKSEWEVGTYWFARQSGVLVRMKRRPSTR